MTGTAFIVATAAYPLDAPESWDAWTAKQEAWLMQAAQAGARLAVFPEYGAMELAALAGRAVAADLAACRAAVADRLEEAAARLSVLAARHDIYVIAGSGPAHHASGFVNRAYLVGPNGVLGHQDKLIMTQYERDTWGIEPGAGLTLFDLGWCRMGVLICYDCEFPVLARCLVDVGADVIAVPSCTDTRAGAMRVRIGARARALEGQCITVAAATVGPAPWCSAVDVNRGSAGVFGPPDTGFPDTGILAQGPRDAPGWTCATLDPAAISTVRREGQVRNHAHWPEQHGTHIRVTKHTVP